MGRTPGGSPSLVPSARPRSTRLWLVLLAVLPVALLLSTTGIALALGSALSLTGWAPPPTGPSPPRAAVADPAESAEVAPTAEPVVEPAAEPTVEPSSPAPTPTDSEGDGVVDDDDAYPTDPSRHNELDRDGDGTPNDADVAPDDPAIAAWPKTRVVSVIDGDTVDVEGLGRIRLIGIDAPERGECGYQHAVDLMRYLVLDKQVTLVPGARDDRDSYGRLLRYVDVGGKDAGREMIGTGWAVARYDSRDGYGAHTREQDYVAFDARVANKTCPPPAPAPAPQPAAPAANCDPSYPTVCIPPYPPDLDCGEISHRRFAVRPPDRHGFDGDNDGIGCESG